MDEDNPNAEIEQLLASLEERTGLEAHGDRYPFLLRLGDDWTEYSFEWEPFRNVAGVLQNRQGAPLIVIVSDGSQLHVEGAQDPIPHDAIYLGPATPVAELVEVWVRALIDRGVSYPSAPADWFFENLGLEPRAVPADVRGFLGVAVEPPKKSEPQSQRPIDRSGPLSDLVSGSVSAINDKIVQENPETGIDAVISSFEIAREIQTTHGEYASHQLRNADLVAPVEAEKRSWRTWLESAISLYDMSEVADSKHEVLDGRLLLVAVGLMDPFLQDQLRQYGVWAPLLLEIDEAAVRENTQLESALGAIKLAHGYQSDSATGPDQLGVASEVNAICEVLTDPNVRPPLAVGLFGAWGSGKTFFMEKMRQRVHHITTQRSDRPEQNVVQIRFNAWHYSDTSLWASLAVEIFERLLDPEPVDEASRDAWLRDHGDSHRQERERLLQQLETYREAKAVLAAEQARLEAERTKLEQRRNEITEARIAALDEADITDVAGELAAHDDIRAAIDDITQTLGLTPAVDELHGLASELRTTGGQMRSVWRLVNHKIRTLAFMAAFTVLALASLAFAAAGQWSWIGSLVSGIGSAGSLLVVVTRYLRPAARQANRGLAAVESTLARAREIEAELRARRSREELELELILADHQAQIVEATRGISELNDKIAKVTTEAEQLTVGRRLYHFLADRVSHYEEYQGVVGMLHRDFRRLDAQLRVQRQPDSGPGPLPRIDRVVLYIDDLDRCPPEKVLEVLEAVHLLLALELFIVVVGVDPRWLQRSLRHQYRSLVTGDDAASDPYLRTMPTEYLEKIFQIPLTLPAMEPSSFGRLIASLAPSVAAPDLPTDRPGGPTRRPTTTESPGGDRMPTRALLRVQPGSAASGEAGQGIDLTRPEVEYAQQLCGLVDTPRAAKRLMNTYRLVRATQHVGSRSRFLGSDGNPGEYYAVLTLLAAAAGYPSLADRLLVALEQATEDSHIQGWTSFVTELNPGQGDDVPGRLAPHDLRRPDANNNVSNADAAEWWNLWTGLHQSLTANKLEDLSTYQQWGRVVARFSFTVG